MYRRVQSLICINSGTWCSGLLCIEMPAVSVGLHIDTRSLKVELQSNSERRNNSYRLSYSSFTWHVVDHKRLRNKFLSYVKLQDITPEKKQSFIAWSINYIIKLNNIYWLRMSPSTFSDFFAPIVVYRRNIGWACKWLYNRDRNSLTYLCRNKSE